MRLNKEPVAILAAAGGIVTALTALGILSPELGGGIGTILVVIGGMFVRGKVTPNSTVVEKVAQGGVLVAQKLDAETAGLPGTVTPTAQGHVADVVTQLLGTPAPVAVSTVDSVLGPRKRREPRTPL